MPDPPRGCLAISGDSFSYSSPGKGSVTGTYTKHPIMHRPPTTKNDLIQNVNGAEVKKPCLHYKQAVHWTLDSKSMAFLIYQTQLHKQETMAQVR